MIPHQRKFKRYTGGDNTTHHLSMKVRTKLCIDISLLWPFFRLLFLLNYFVSSVTVDTRALTLQTVSAAISASFQTINLRSLTRSYIIWISLIPCQSSISLSTFSCLLRSLRFTMTSNAMPNRIVGMKTSFLTSSVTSLHNNRENRKYQQTNVRSSKKSQIIFPSPNLCYVFVRRNLFHIKGVKGKASSNVISLQGRCAMHD